MNAARYLRGMVVGNRWWSVLFAVTMALCGGLFIVAPLVGWWMPPGFSTHSDDVDNLFYIILYITGFFFVATEALLVIFMFKYVARDGIEPPPRTRFDESVGKLLRPVSKYINSTHRLEMAWTVVPAIILLYIAFAQVGAWARIKYYSRTPQLSSESVPIQAAVSARQFEWRMRYPSLERMKNWLSYKDADAKERPQIKKDNASFARTPQADDVHTVNALHTFGDYYKSDANGKFARAERGAEGAVWKADPTLVQLSTIDVLHSFNIPHLRVKQDALPGKQIAVWFTPTTWNTLRVDENKWQDGYNRLTGKFEDANYIWDIACAELCGWGHYRMIGRLYVHETEQDFLDWLKAAQAAETATK